MKFTTQTLDVTTLGRLIDHPRLQAARRALNDAERMLVDADAAHAKACERLADAEDAAATGKRDERGLAAARQAIHDSVSEQRIRRRAADRAREALDATTRDVQQETFDTLKSRRDDALREMDSHLEGASACSHLASALEDALQRLLPSGPYAQSAEFSIQPLAWRREFGSGGASDANSRLAHWRAASGLFDAPRPVVAPPKVVVRFLRTVSLPNRHVSGYNQGDVAGFEPAVAKTLVAQGFAVVVE